MEDVSLPPYLCLIAIAIIMILNALIVANKRALDYVDRAKIKEEVEDDPDNKRLSRVTDFLAKPSKYHYADHVAQIINAVLCFFLLNVMLFAIVGFEGVQRAAIIALSNIGFFLIYNALSDILPKKLAAQSTEWTGTRLIWLQTLVYVLTYPLVIISKGIANLLLKIFGKDIDVDDSVVSEERIMSMLNRGQDSGEFNEEGIKLIDSIFEFDDLLAYEIMTPRTDVLMIDVDAPRSEYFDELMELTHSRIPVFQGDPDNIIGILHIKEYLHNATKKGFDEVDIGKLLRPAYFVPETKNIDALFKELQKEKQHLAILIDEYGGFSGIVSVEDIIEQIVGDIDDEFDEEDSVIDVLNDNSFIVDGKIKLDDLSEETQVELESDNSETIGGFVIDLIGEIPRENVKYDTIHYENYDFTILEVKDRRIEKLRIDVVDREEDSDE